MMHKRYTKEQCTAAEAQRLAQEIAFGPVVFQVSRLMLKFGIFQLLSGSIRNNGSITTRSGHKYKSGL